MKVPIEWIGDYVDLNDISEAKLADRLTMVGLEVEEINDSEDGRVFVTKVTPNRGDWMSIVGVAREASAAIGRPFRALKPSAPKEPGDAAKFAKVFVENTEWCPRFGIRVIQNVANIASPEFIQKRLIAAGMRPLGIAVDITNYVMLEVGQPLHAYDYDTLPGGIINVRPAQDSEKIVTLDGAERELTSEMLVIADRDKPIGIAGIMGGGATEVTESTKTVLLEAAHFDASVIRRASKKLGLTTEASYRFERFVDPALVSIAQDLACELFAKYAGATLINGAIDTNPNAAKTASIHLRSSRVNALLGAELTNRQMSDALESLQISVSPASDGFDCIVPSFRPDVVKEVDLVEEVGRIVGYENMPETLPHFASAGGDCAKGKFESALRRLFIAQGMNEAHSHTLGAVSAFDDPELEPYRVKLRSALSSDLSVLRLSLVPGLLIALASNLRRHETDIRLFELGKTYRTFGSQKYSEPRRAAGALTGVGIDFFTAKGVIENALTALHVKDVVFTRSALHGCHPGRCASISVNGSSIGFVAEIDPDFAKLHLDLPSSASRIAVFEIDADALLQEAAKIGEVIYIAPPKFPAVSRDLSLTYRVETLYGEIEQTARTAVGEFLESVSLLSVYTGDKMPEGFKSVAIRLTLRAENRTLTDADADSVLSNVHEALTNRLGGAVR